MDISLSETSNVSVPDIDLAASASSVPQARGKRVAHDAALGSMIAENTSQGSCEEPCTKRLRLNLYEKCSGKANDLSSFSFLKKLWEIVESSHFQSIGWADDGNSIVIEETFFKREVLARRGRLQIFDIDSMKTFIRQLHLHGFFIIEGDLPRSAACAKFLADEAAVSTFSKVRCLPTHEVLLGLVGLVVTVQIRCLKVGGIWVSKPTVMLLKILHFSTALKWQECKQGWFLQWLL